MEGVDLLFCYHYSEFMKKKTTIEELAALINKGFESQTKYFDDRFEKIDERFDLMDERFEKIEGHLDHLDARVGRIEADIHETKIKM